MNYSLLLSPHPKLLAFWLWLYDIPPLPHSQYLPTSTKMENNQEASSSSNSKTSEGNTDRLLPRCVHRKRRKQSDINKETKKLRESESGKEELDTLRHMVPSLRVDDGKIDTIDVIERTISYIQELHDKIAQRVAAHQEKVVDILDIFIWFYISYI